MNNLELTYVPYSTKLKKPFRASGLIITERNGFILFLKSESKSIGIGEAAPLAEFGSESYKETERALENFSLKLSIDFANIEESVEQNLKTYDMLPSLKCGLELAILKLISNEKKTSIPALLKRSYPEFILVNAVIGFTPYNKAGETAAELVGNGYGTLKIKVGRDDFEEDIKTISEIRKTIGKDIKLRIDANAKWNRDETLQNLTSLEQFNIEYAEQPVKNLDDFLFIKDKIKIPLAADESIRTMKDAEEIVAKKAAQFLILKPMMLGGIIPTLKIAGFAKGNGIESVVTSSFENIIGKIGVVNAAALVNNNLSHGLSTADYFDETDIPDPFPVSEGKILFGSK
ncbi:MAG: o-succinylbenzoate synthase [Ignavibacteria bacterium GWA2_35_9]|nr:MAG: o-succinylbenzoate synthase [Ignavibacteria bacterium GWA2_35_9]